jgi:hypothetical protein
LVAHAAVAASGLRMRHSAKHVRTRNLEPGAAPLGGALAAATTRHAYWRRGVARRWSDRDDTTRGVF